MQNILISLRNIACLWFLTAFLYPAVILIIAQVAFFHQANGSLITNPQGEMIGSTLIGQTFTSAQYFWSRPSTINYSEGKAASPTGVSGASNLAPDNPVLLNRITVEAQRLQQADIQPTADLLYTSGSGLDPHISPEAAKAQIARIARARHLSAMEIQTLIQKHTDGPFLGIFGEPGVNVLTLNLALDTLE